MSNDPAAFRAEYSDIRVIHGRGVIKISLEAPVEAWSHINDVLGPPTKGASTWVAVAKIEPDVEAR